MITNFTKLSRISLIAIGLGLLSFATISATNIEESNPLTEQIVESSDEIEISQVEKNIQVVEQDLKVEIDQPKTTNQNPISNSSSRYIPIEDDDVVQELLALAEEPVQTIEATSEPVTESSIDDVPSLDEFAAQVRAEGLLGLWAEGHFAYRVYFASWGQVPDTYNTASHASTQGYSGFFIHNYLGGDRLYRVPKWTKVAVIWPDRIEWFIIDGTVRYEGTPSSKTCGYKAPFFEWGQELKKKGGLSAENILTRHYSKPFTIQTSICQGGVVGVHILIGTWTTSEASDSKDG